MKELPIELTIFEILGAMFPLIFFVALVVYLLIEEIKEDREHKEKMKKIRDECNKLRKNENG